ncbi:MAG TPA: 2-C-methyl-D-erythritol 4-phosphate cytidylyltransferase [Tepidisphaeraceae bacterium]|nr:2-C-methyl-D-erythritol 4-phosphate cytidylyltransferase [Tepidisphaeraceae bacterium]
MAATFSVLVLTAPPPGLGSEGGGAFVKIDGREALLRSVELFLNRDNIKQIQLAILPDEMEEAKRKYGAHLGFSGVKLINGGPRWVDQLSAAAATISPDATHVIVHDAARPAVPYSDIDALLAEAEQHPAVALTTPLRTTIIETDEGGNPVGSYPPQRYVQLLTPQAFSKAKFAEIAAAKAEVHPSQWKLIKGSPLNIRAGGPGEAGLIKTMINMLPKPKLKAPSSPFEEAQW